MSQHLVYVVEEAQAWRRGLQPVQPQRVAAHPQEVSRVKVDQVVTVIARRSLKVREKDLRGGLVALTARPRRERAPTMMAM